MKSLPVRPSSLSASPKTLIDKFCHSIPLSSHQSCSNLNDIIHNHLRHQYPILPNGSDEDFICNRLENTRREVVANSATWTGQLMPPPPCSPPLLSQQSRPSSQNSEDAGRRLRTHGKASQSSSQVQVSVTGLGCALGRQLSQEMRSLIRVQELDSSSDYDDPGAQELLERQTRSSHR